MTSSDGRLVITNIDRGREFDGNSDDSDFDDVRHVIGAREAMKEGVETKSVGRMSRDGRSRSRMSVGVRSRGLASAGGVSMKSSKARAAVLEGRKKASGLHSGRGRGEGCLVAGMALATYSGVRVCV